MTKIFVGSAPLQKTVPTQYCAKDNSRLQFDRTIDHPLYAMLHGYAQKGEAVKIIICVTDHSVAKENAIVMKDSIHRMGEEFGFIPEIIELMLENDEGLVSHASLLSNLVKLCGEDDVFYVDITYGTKPTPIVFFNFLRFMSRAHNSGIGCVCYARFEHKNPDKPSYIYDISPLYMMTTIIDHIAESNQSDPNRLFNLLLGEMNP